jgi:carboxyl-terminal processing protease
MINISERNLKRIKIGAGILVFVAIIFGGGFWLGQAGAKSHFGNRPLAYSPDSVTVNFEAATGSPLSFNLYWEVWDSIKGLYVDKNKLDDKTMFYGSLRGLAQSTSDPYTVFMDPQESQEFIDDLAGKFEGIGAEIGMRNDISTVIAPLDGMPAQKAGVRAGDKIYAVDNVTTLGLTVDEVVKKIRGPKDTKVTLTIIRGSEKPRDIVITRSVIAVKSVKTEMRTDGIFVIRVSSFNDDTAALFSEAVNSVLLKNPKGIILDLRNNPGGYLETSIEMAGEWIKEGPIVAEQLNDNKRNEYPASGRARLQDFPTVALINGGSASASEILAGALRDYKKATLVGETSYGKGSVQTIKDLSDGSSLKVTIAHWLTPAGDFINEKGIKPNVEVKMTATDVEKNLDPQFNKALEILKAKKK